MNTSLQNLITNEDREVIHELTRLTPIIKNKYFSLGRDIDRFMKLIGSFGQLKEETHGTILESFSCSSSSGNTTLRVRQTVITNT
jgi:hypothetical protein